MKILFVFNHPAPYKVALFNGLAKHFDVHVIFERLSAKNRNLAFYSEKQYDFTLHPIKGISLSHENHLSWGIKKHLQTHKYDLIVMNGYATFSELIAIQYLKTHHIPYIFYINGGIIKKESSLKRKIKTHFISGAKHYFSSAYKANEYLIHYGADPEKIVNYPYATIYEKDVVKQPLDDKTKKEFWQNLNIKGENFTICATSFIKRKNNVSLINAWLHIDKDHTLILVGQGKEQKRYEKLIKDNKQNNVYLLPFANRKLLFTYLKHAHNAVYVSNFDIYGHVINEALAHGLNVLTNSHMVAAHELIKNDQNGLLITDSDLLENKIKELFTKNYFEQAIKSARTIEQEVLVHVAELEKLV